MAVDVVHALEVVDVEHQQRHRVVRPVRARELGPQPLVEVAMVVEARERVGLRLALEARADVGVVERERGRVAEPARELELLGREDRVLAEPVDVERALDLVPREQRHADQRLGLVVRRAGHDLAPAGRRCAAFVCTGSRCSTAQPVRPSPNCGRRAEDLVGPPVAREHGDQQAPRLVGLVDGEALVGDEVGERVRDPVEQRVEALLGEDVVEDLGEAAVRLDERLGGRRDDW